MMRVFAFELFPYFYTMATQSQYYEDCSRKAKKYMDVFRINLIVLSCVQFLLFSSILLFMIKKKKILFNLQVEEANIFQRLVIFSALFNTVDTNLQNYNALNNIN